jgi:signal transduction histidine kinase
VSRRIRILHLEDDPADAELVARALRAEHLDCDITLVSDRAAFEKALRTPVYDIVLSDYSIPGFGGLAAADLMREQPAELPFILVTGTIGDEGAGAALRAGVTDYVLKNRLERLGPALRRALDEAHERRRRRELEEQLRQSQKMEAVGQLTGGIAHDFNNVLTIMIASAELVAMGLRSEQGQQREDLEALLKAGLRGKEMIRKLLSFSRRQPLEPRPLDVPLFLSGIADTLRRLLPARITVAYEIEEGLPPLQADAGSLEQMVLNLATNARDAMPGGGTIALIAALARADDPVLERHNAAAGRFVRLALRDSGVGMTEEVLQRVFEPFFTTKPADKGTGLGMSMIYGLAQQQGGFVDIASQVGKGTTVSLYFPIAASGPQPAPAPPPPPSTNTDPAGGGDLILVADDEAVLRRALERTLAAMGYRVITAGSGGEALEKLIANKDKLSLVITDQMMPAFGGADLYREARANGFTVPFLVTSGYSSEELAGKGFGPEVQRLMKPWTSEELAAAVGFALRQQPRPTPS